MGIPPLKKVSSDKKVFDLCAGESSKPRKKIDLFSISVLNSLSAHVAVIDTDGDIIAINEAWKNFARNNGGNFRAVTVGANYFKACRQASMEDDVEAAAAIDGIKSVLNRQFAEYELEYACHSPTKQRWFIMRVTPMQFMGNKAVVSHIDISEKKLAQDSLAEREKELSALNMISRMVNSATSVRGVTQAILSQISATIHPNLILIFLKEGEDLLLRGMGPENTALQFDKTHIHRVGQCLCGLSVSTRKSIFSKDIQCDNRCTWQECKQAGLTSFAAIPMKNRDEVIGTLGIASVQMRDFRQHRHFLEAMANDVAISLDNTLLYEKAKLYAQNLEVQLVERKEMENRLRQTQKMEAIGKLAGGIAHDFNNILSPILGFTELALNDLPKDTPPHHFLSEVLKAGSRAKDLVRQILTLTRQAEGKFRPIDISFPVKEAIALLRSSLPSTINFVGSIPTGLRPIKGDATQIHQIVMNLCTNAAHAMDNSGGTLEVSLEEVFWDSKFIVNYKVLPKGYYIKLTISDTGEGIAPNILESIFDPYFTTKEKGRGTGLGLTVVQGITKRHGGEINVYSEPFKGTTFTLYFPTIDTKVESLPETDRKIPGGTESILLVDDEIAITQMGRQMLQNLGYSVVTTTRSEEALRLFHENPYGFDAVVTDWTMPNLRGDKLAEKISQIRHDIAIVICSGFSRSISMKVLKNLDIRSILPKPFTKKEIAMALREAIDRKTGKSTNRKSTPYLS